MTATTERRSAQGTEAVAGLLARASRVMVGLTLRALDRVDPGLTLVQLRLLTELEERGPLRVGELATVLGVHASTVTRAHKRLLVEGRVERHAEPADRRGVAVVLAPPGRDLLARVEAARVSEAQRLLAGLAGEERAQLADALEVLLRSHGEPVRGRR